MKLLNQYLTLEVPMAVNLAADGLQEYEFDGYASVFGVVNSYGFTFDSGAFTKTLKENPNPVLLWQHWSDEPIGVIAFAEEDRKGLKIRGRLVPEVDRAKAAHALLKAEALRGLSIGFIPLKSTPDSGKGVDHVTEAKLREVSLVTFPADPKAGVSRVLSEIAQLDRNRDELSQDDIKRAIVHLTALLREEEPGQPTPAVLEPQTISSIRESISELRKLQGDYYGR